MNFALPLRGQRSRRRHEAAVRSSTSKSSAAASSPTCWIYSDSVMTAPTLHTSCYYGKSRLHTSRVRLANSVAHASQMESKTRKRAYRKEVGRRLKAARHDSKNGTQDDGAAALSLTIGETNEPSAICTTEQGTRTT